ncbi:protein OSCP1-like [Rhopilema esculentum]|uniref:protein OSCP1-like n=1 Tax=Rhopilema esculentum TaxID=499914 RepID=UPI0031DDC6D0
MSLKTLPMLFLNLGGEMMYILDQRLRAQNIPKEKSRKVMHDIVGTMLNGRFMTELFKPQDAYSKKAMRTVFDKLAHASIMRLNSASMDKLYDLMTMAFKHQVSLCQRPQDILLITLNHLDAMREFVKENETVLQQVENVFALLKQHYGNLCPGQFQLIRMTILSFFQDMHIRVSIFLKDKVQTPNGRFILPKDGQVPWDTEVPGTIRLFENGKQAKTKSFKTSVKCQLADKPGSYELLGDRVTKLGRNMYEAARQVDTTIQNSGPKPAPQAAPEQDLENRNPLAKAELNLLSYLIAGDRQSSGNSFRLNLFSTDEEEQNAEKEYAKVRHREILIDATQKKQQGALSQLMNEFSIEGTTGSTDKGDDLLELMDAASK